MPVHQVLFVLRGLAQMKFERMLSVLPSLVPLVSSAKQRQHQQRGQEHVHPHSNAQRELPTRDQLQKDFMLNILGRLSPRHVCQASMPPLFRLPNVMNVRLERHVCLRAYLRLKSVDQARFDQQVVKMAMAVSLVLKARGPRTGD